jgi:hypothetical protein
MNADDASTKVSEWRWDRFNVRKPTTKEWAARNCFGIEGNTDEARNAMHVKVLEEKREAEQLIRSEINELLRVASEITGMRYKCKYTEHNLKCITIKDLRVAWVQDGSAENLMRMAWMFYYYATELYQNGLAQTHGETVERKLMSKMKFVYVHLDNLPINQRTCVHQLYSKVMNEVRANIMRRTNLFVHKSHIQKEQPQVRAFRKNFKREKTTFFASFEVADVEKWFKVRTYTSVDRGRSIVSFNHGVCFVCGCRWTMLKIAHGLLGIKRLCCGYGVKTMRQRLSNCQKGDCNHPPSSVWEENWALQK